MPGCERCWADARHQAAVSGEDQLDIYHQLLNERTCTPEQQAGEEAKWCPRCKRHTGHQVTGECMVCHIDVRIEAP